jgi:ADP-dependent NAD(P)H-hydrate dehydratase / NAD(P)H-hydrate epimerase
VNLPVVSSAEVRVAEEAAFARGIAAEELMNEAGTGIARAVQQFFPRSGHCLVFAGKGNNGGDALVAATRLKCLGWHTDVHLSFPESECSELLRKKISEFRDAAAVERPANLPVPLVVLDGLLGLGSKPPLRDPILSSCREINRLRHEQNAFVFAVDQPSGLDGDTGQADPDCVIADFTVTIAAAKRGLIADGAVNFVGRLVVVPLRELQSLDNEETVACAASLQGLLPRRDFDAFKNQFGRIGIVAGSRGLVGAAILCAEGALRSGAGLVEVFVLDEIYSIVAAAAPAEAMIKPLSSYAKLQDEAVDSWAVGPGLGKLHAQEILDLVERTAKPMVVDADALNILSSNVELLKASRGPRLLTPHPGEMKRLTRNQKAPRVEIARSFTSQFPITLLLKGSRTIVAESGTRVSYNSSGNPAMATGGMGDVLTGVCAALIGQKLSLFDAARVGAWVCGRAAEIALFNNGASQQSLLPRDVLEHLGRAFRDLQSAVA